MSAVRTNKSSRHFGTRSTPLWTWVFPRQYSYLRLRISFLPGQYTCQRAGKIKICDTLVLSWPPYEHEYSPGNTHIYAYGHHSYVGNTHIVGVKSLVRSRWCEVVGMTAVGVKSLVWRCWCEGGGVKSLVWSCWCEVVGVKSWVWSRWCEVVGGSASVWRVVVWKREPTIEAVVEIK
jgi:hypothetical protein